MLDREVTYGFHTVGPSRSEVAWHMSRFDSAAGADNLDSCQVIALMTQDTSLTTGLRDVQPVVLSTAEDLSPRIQPKAIIIDYSICPKEIITWARRTFPAAFIVVYHPPAQENPAIRLLCFDYGVNMVAHDISSILKALRVAVIPSGLSGRYSCPYCPFRNMTERDVWYHCPTYHINWPTGNEMSAECPICRERLRTPLQVHIHEEHGPDKWSKSSFQPGHPTVARLYNFSLVICRHPQTGKFLLCQEFANQGFWCPGGAVDAGEVLTAAARRETMEEAGIDVEMKGILSIEYHPSCPGNSRNSVSSSSSSSSHRSHRQQQQDHIVRLRVVFYAEPTPHGLQQLPKSIPDFESAGACWCSLEEIQGRDSIRLRGSEPRRWSKYLADGGVVYPMSLLEERVVR